MKRTARICLAVLLAVALALPAAAAADPTDQRMAQVTQAVKEQLDIDGSYTTFYGELSEDGLRATWTLNWEKEGERLRVEAGQDGTIYRYQRYRDGETGPQTGASFPDLSRQEALPAAQAFAARVLHAPAGVALTAEGGWDRVGLESYDFQAQLLYYGLPTPIGVWLEVDARDGTVSSYQRDDLYQPYLNAPADPTPYEGAEDQAAPLLKDTLELKLEYVLDEADPDRAVLRYVPVYGDSFYVDAATGALVNLTQLYRELDQGMGGSSGAPGAGSDSNSTGESLTDTEQAGIAQMAGVWSREDLDRQARSLEALKLAGWTLDACDYRLDRETGAVTATLRYARTQEGSTSRTVSLDGKTGALLGAGGYAWTEEDYEPAVDRDAAQTMAEGFLSGLWGEQWQTCALYDSTPAGEGSRVHTFTFAQQVNGVFFPENTITVGVDSADGTILRLSRSFDAHPAFDSPDGMISGEMALDTWFDTYAVTLGYVAVPRRLEDYGAQYQDLLEGGYTYQVALELGCTLEQESTPLGIDAKTGQPVARPSGTPDRPVYSDLEGSWGKAQAEALAAYGMGWLGGKLEPSKSLTQLDLMALMVSADGYLADLSQEGAADRVYDRAVAMGLLTRSQRQDGQTVTRAELVKVLLDWGGYGNAAVIPGIFRCGFADQADIPEGYYGYAAIAQGLGVAQGDEAGRFEPNRTATRLEAVVMLYQLMAR